MSIGESRPPLACDGLRIAEESARGGPQAYPWAEAARKEAEARK